MVAFRVRARNVARDSGNPLHSDEGAAALGLEDPPIAGMTTVDYAIAAVVGSWNGAWPRRAGVDCRLLQPIPDGCELDVCVDEVPGETRCVLTQFGARESAPSAVISAWQTGSGLLAPWHLRDMEPSSRLAISALQPGMPLGALASENTQDLNGDHLSEMERVCGPDPLMSLREHGTVVPGTLVDIANQIVMRNIDTGSWIHARSRIQFHDLLRSDQKWTAHGFVSEVRDHPDGQMVLIDIRFIRTGRVVARMEHSAIV